MRKCRKSEPVPNPQRKIKMQTRKNEAESADFRFGFGVGVKIFFAVLCLFGKGSHFIDKLVEKLKRIVHGLCRGHINARNLQDGDGSMLLPALRNLM